jgi:hypothetical protein
MNVPQIKRHLKQSKNFKLKIYSKKEKNRIVSVNTLHWSVLQQAYLTAATKMKILTAFDNI